MDFLFFGLTGASLYVFRKRDANNQEQGSGYRVPGHPVTTAIFVLTSWLVVVNTVYKYPRNTLVGFAILLLGVPVYGFWAHKQRKIGERS
jgi:APA family basic amino acid/polyamine antiporter